MKWVAGLLLFLMACTTPQSGSRKGQEQVGEPSRYRIGMRRDVDSFNPYVSTSLEGQIIAARLYPTLFEEQPANVHGIPQLEPRLVDTWSFSDDGRVLELRLKPGLTWSDGHVLGSEDVVYSFGLQTNADLAWVSSDSKANIESVEALGDRDLRVRFDSASPLNLMNVNEGVLVPKHAFSAVPLTDWMEHDWSRDLVVFGPYALASHEPGQSLVLQARDGSHQLGFAVVRDKETLYQLLRSGDLDYAWTLPVERMADIRVHLNPVFFPDLTYAYVAWNPMDPSAVIDATLEDAARLERAKQGSPHPVLADARVRKALGLAMNRWVYVERFLEGEGRVPATPWRVGMTSGPKLDPDLPFDPEQASSLLEEAGWAMKDGLRYKGDQCCRITVICNAGSPLREHVLLAAQNDLKQIGVDLQLDFQETGLYLSNLDRRKFDGAFGMFRREIRPDLAELFHSRAAGLGGYNYASWSGADEALDRLLKAATEQEVFQGITEVEARFLEAHPVTVLFEGITVGATRKMAWHPKANYLDPLYRVETW